jgi:hypothetical protein
MSQLEGRIHPLIGSMMHDLSIRLDRTEQHLIAAWCVKTAMVFEWTNPGPRRFYSKTEREHLRLDLSIRHAKIISDPRHPFNKRLPSGYMTWVT